MMGWLEGKMERVLKVPPQPDPPFGSSDTLQVFRAGKGYYRYRFVSWIVRQIGTLIGLVVGFVWIHSLDDVNEKVYLLLLVGEVLAAIYFFLVLPLSFLMVSLDYRYRWYMVTDHSLRIREGLLKVSENTMTFSNIQNLSIRQGPIQRYFGIADLEVRTAGGGSSTGSGQPDDPFSDNLHTGFFRGVDNAEEIRDLVLGHLRRTGGAGLGDPDDARVQALAARQETAGSGETLAAARALLTEVQALRTTAVLQTPGDARG